MNKIDKILKYGDVCVLILLVCNFFILLGDPIDNDIMVSMASRVMIITVCLFGGSGFLKILRNKRALMMDFFLVLFVFATLLVICIDGALGLLSNAISLICFFMFSFLALIYRKLLKEDKIKKWIYIGNFAYFMIYVYLYNTPLKYIKYGEYGAQIGDDLTLGYQNSNQTGLQLFVTFIIMLSLFEVTQKWWIKILSGISTAIIFYMIYETNSRTCVVLSGITLVLYIIKLLDKINERIISIVFGVPVVSWFAIYVSTFYDGQLTFLGDAFDTGRIIIFRNVIKNMDLFSFLFGKFNTYCSNNFHNSYFTILAIYGVVVLVFYLIYLRMTYTYYFQYIQKFKQKNRVAFVGLLGIIAHGASEATFLVSGMIYASLAALLFVLVQDKGETECL